MGGRDRGEGEEIEEEEGREEEKNGKEEEEKEEGREEEKEEEEEYRKGGRVWRGCLYYILYTAYIKMRKSMLSLKVKNHQRRETEREGQCEGEKE